MAAAVDPAAMALPTDGLLPLVSPAAKSPGPVASIGAVPA
jgi:hypothetical protein